MLRHIHSTVVTHSLAAIVELHFWYGSGHSVEHPGRSWLEEFRGHDLPATAMQNDLREPYWSDEKSDRGSWYLHLLLCFRSWVVAKMCDMRDKNTRHAPQGSHVTSNREFVAWARSKRTRLDRSDVYEHTRFVDGMDCVRRGWRKAGASPGRETHRWHWRGGETASSHRPASLLYRMLSHLPHDINASQLHHQRHGSKNAQITIRKLLET